MGFHRIAAASEIPSQGGLKVRLGRDEIAIFRDGGEYRAINDLCPHRGAPLSEGFLEQGRVFCPWHCFDFSLCTGESSIAPHLRVATYVVEVRDNQIYLDYPDELVCDNSAEEAIDEL